MMGHTTMKTANGPAYRDVTGTDFRVLMFLAQKTLDHDSAERDKRTWNGGHAPIVEWLYDLKPGDAGYDTKTRIIRRAIEHLEDVDAIRRNKRAAAGRHAEYEVCPIDRRTPSSRSILSGSADTPSRTKSTYPVGRLSPGSRSNMSAEQDKIDLPIEGEQEETIEETSTVRANQSAEDPSSARWLVRAERLRHA
jgi:hypothetical protein